MQKNMQNRWVRQKLLKIGNMSKAEERYLECFQDGRVRNCNSKEVFLLGYSQAEKYLELTWEDISVIRQIMFDYHKILREQKPIHIPSDKDYCQEVLKRFKSQKGEQK